MATATRITYDLFPKQDDFVQTQTPFSAFVGGVGSGKTRAGAVKSILYSLEHPHSLGMVTAPTYPMLRDATLRTFRELLPKELYEFHEGDMRLVFRNGSEVLFRSTDDPDRLRGPNLAFVYMDEAAQSKADAFKILQGRLRQEGFTHQLWLTTTPMGFNWVYQEFAMQERADYFLVPVSTRENVFLTPDFVRRLQESYADDFALQEIEGHFIIVGGKAFFWIEAVRSMLARVEEPTIARGLVKVWKKPYIGGRYVMGCDVAWGEKGAYSCASVMDWQTGEVVAEIHGRPGMDENALEIVTLAREYNGAYVVIENNGEGKAVVDKVLELGYRNIFYQDWESRSPSKPGWHTDSLTRPLMLAEFEEAVRFARVRIPCRDAVSEMMSFVRKRPPNDRPVRST